MPKYEVTYSVLIPYDGEVVVDALDEDEAEELAIKEIEGLYPENEELNIDIVREVEE